MAVSPERELLERIDELIERGVVSIRDVIAGARTRPECRLEPVRVERDLDDVERERER